MKNRWREILENDIITQKEFQGTKKGLNSATGCQSWPIFTGSYREKEILNDFSFSL